MGWVDVRLKVLLKGKTFASVSCASKHNCAYYRVRDEKR